MFDDRQQGQSIYLDSALLAAIATANGAAVYARYLRQTNYIESSYHAQQGTRLSGLGEL